MVLHAGAAHFALPPRGAHQSFVTRPLFRLSVDDFSRPTFDRLAGTVDLDRTWTLFRPVATTLVDGYRTALDLHDADAIADVLDQLPRELRGIGYQGAGMGLAALDARSPRGSRLRQLILGRGAPHQCLIHLGAGMVLARLRRNPMRFLERHDPSLRWLLLDGYGFHDGFFRWSRFATPPDLPGYGPNAYDQGVGRSLWFLAGADVSRIGELIADFAESRRADLWSGVGVAWSYKVGLHDVNAGPALLDAAGPLADHLAVGVAVGTLFRDQCGDAAFADPACSAIWGLDGHGVASLAHQAGRVINQNPTDPPGDRYPRWRAAIRATWLSQRDRELWVVADVTAPAVEV